MGNTITKSNDVKILKNDTIFEKEINKILRNRTEIFEKVNGKYLEEPVNQIRACCMDIVKEKPTNKDFISIKLPKATDNKECTENCITTESYGLQFQGKRIELCGDKLKKGRGGACDGWMINNCAKELYDNDCISIEKDKETGKFYKSWNKKCLNKDGTLKYIKDDCACLNSVTGFNLNMEPSNKIKGGFLFDNKNDNPYGIKGSVKNNYTKYSLNMFNVPYKVQQPMLFDKKCLSKEVNIKKGTSKAYTLSTYDNTESELCMNDFDMGTYDRKNFSNIEQNTNCNSVATEFKKSNKKFVDLNGDKSVDKKHSYRILKEATYIIDKEKKLDNQIKNVRKYNIENKSGYKVKSETLENDYNRKIRDYQNKSIKSKSKLRKQIAERGGKIDKMKDSILYQEEELYDQQNIINNLNEDNAKILDTVKILKKELDDKNGIVEEELDEIDDETEEENVGEKKESIYVSMGYLIFLLAIIVIFYNVNRVE